MAKASGRISSDKWDVSRVWSLSAQLTAWGISQDGPAAKATWIRADAARTLAFAQSAQPEFMDHARAVRAGADPVPFARRYPRRDQGRRVELICACLLRAASALAAPPGASYGDDDVARAWLWNIVPMAWVVDAQADPTAPARARPTDAITLAAIRVARRGAGRCADLNCRVDGKRIGQLLSRDNKTDYCANCRPKTLSYTVAQRSDIEAERELFDRAIASVLGGDSRARARRVRAEAERPV